MTVLQDFLPTKGAQEARVKAITKQQQKNNAALFKPGAPQGIAVRIPIKNL